MTPHPDSGPSNDFDPIADVYEELVSWAPYDAWVRNLARRLAGRGMGPADRVLDVACGTGLSTVPWAERGHEVVGVDRSRPMLRLARRKAAGLELPVRFVRADMLSLDWPGAFDVVVCMHSGLDYILDLRTLRRAFRSLRGCLRVGGLLAFDKCLDEPDFYQEPATTSREISCGTATFHYRWHRARKWFDQRCVIERRGSGGRVRRTEILHRMRAIEPGRLVCMVEEVGFRVLEPPRPFTAGDPGMGIFEAV